MGLMDYTAVELGKKIKAGEVSVLEAANAAMDAIDALEDKFNCYVTVQERAAVQAKAEELQKKIDDGTLTGPLAGVPVAVKDNMCTKGTRTTCSSIINLLLKFLCLCLHCCSFLYRYITVKFIF